MDDIARVIARMLDNQRARPTAPRSRPLQLFITSDDSVTSSETSTVTITAVGAPRYGVGKYGQVIFGQ